jgi:hypothetical protein
VQRIDGSDHAGVARDLYKAQQSNNDKPRERDRAKHLPNLGSSVTLEKEQHDQNHDCDGHHVRLKQWCRYTQPFYRAKYGDGWRNDAIAVQESGAEKS